MHAKARLALSAERLGKPQQQDNSQNHHRNQEPPETPQWAGGFPSLPGMRYPPGHTDLIRSPQSSLSSLLSCSPCSFHPLPLHVHQKGSPWADKDFAVSTEATSQHRDAAKSITQGTRSAPFHHAPCSICWGRLAGGAAGWPSASSTSCSPLWLPGAALPAPTPGPGLGPARRGWLGGAGCVWPGCSPGAPDSAAGTRCSAGPS